MIKLKGMEWKWFSKKIMFSEDWVEVRSLKIPDEASNFKRYRVTTCWDPTGRKFTRIPARGFLAKDETGKIGAVVIGQGGGYIKIGCRFSGCQPAIFVPLNSLSKKARKSLLRKGSFDTFTEGEFLFARQRGENFFR